MDKFKSRKLWVAIATAGSVFAADYWGVDIQPEALLGIVAIASSYIFGQGIVDKTVNAAKVVVGGDITLAQTQLYARNLEQQVAELVDQLEATDIIQQLTLVDDPEEE